ncbi:unnamed protein product, partial [Gulo gulo]
MQVRPHLRAQRPALSSLYDFTCRVECLIQCKSRSDDEIMDQASLFSPCNEQF